MLIKPMPTHILRLSFALLLGAISVAVFVIYANLIYVNQIPQQNFRLLTFYPLSMGFIAIITAGLFNRNLKSLSFTWPKTGYLRWAALYAVVFTLLPFLFNLLLHLTTAPVPLNIYPQLALFGLPVFLAVAFAEEIMWRGFLYTEFSCFMGFAATSIAIGLLCALWHYPLILHTHLLYSDRPMYFVLPMYTVMIMFSSFIYCYLRRVSGSIWPCALLHGMQNWLLFAFIQPLEQAGYAWSPFFMNNIGILYVLIIMIGGLYFYSVARAAKIISP